MFDVVRLNPSETGLKGHNRDRFEQRLLANIKEKIAAWPEARLVRNQGSILLRLPKPLSCESSSDLLQTLGTVFGIGRLIPGRTTTADLSAIKALAVEMAGGLVGSFKVESRRADKRFPMTSLELSREVGGAVLVANDRLRVDVREPATVIEVYVDVDQATVAVGSQSGPGGLPLGVSGRVVALLSGGIDSPVAAWKMMRRGCPVTYAHCHSYPYVGPESVEKVKRLAETLARHQSDAKLYLLPIGDAQREIVAKATPDYRILLYRRLMLRLAERVAVADRALGLVTGDSAGQVASQTLENLAAVSAVATLPIYRPLIGDNKEDIVRLARSISSYEVSIEPHDDCCSLFVPPNPETRARLADVEREEAKYDVAALVEAVWEKREIIEFKGGKIDAG